MGARKSFERQCIFLAQKETHRAGTGGGGGIGGTGIGGGGGSGGALLSPTPPPF